MNKILLALLIMLCGSCQKTYLALNGIRKPAYETAGSVNKKLSHYNQDYVSINAIPTDTSSMVFLLKTMKGLPSNIIFNRAGLLIDQQDTGYCAGRALKFAMKLGNGVDEPVCPGVRIEEVFQRIIPTGDHLNTSYANYDYSVFIFWTAFLGKSNKNVFHLMEELRTRDDLKVNFILVNMDVQKSWNVTWIPYRF